MAARPGPRSGHWFSERPEFHQKNSEDEPVKPTAALWLLAKSGSVNFILIVKLITAEENEHGRVRYCRCAAAR
jgi:hypothetical protein